MVAEERKRSHKSGRRIRLVELIPKVNGLESCGYIDYRYIESEINENIEKGV